MSGQAHSPHFADDQEEYYDEIEMHDGQVVLICARLSRGSRQFDLTFHMGKWQAPQTISQYLEIYAQLLADKSVTVNNVESLEN